MITRAIAMHPGFVPFLMLRYNAMVERGARMSMRIGDVVISNARRASATQAARYMATVYRRAPGLFNRAVISTLFTVDPGGQICEFCREAIRQNDETM